MTAMMPGRISMEGGREGGCPTGQMIPAGKPFVTKTGLDWAGPP